jgi:ubiquinone/menaquinone biosynthesis C-methylase UbiE
MFNHFDLVAFLYDRVIGLPDVERLRHVLRLPADGIMLDAGGGTGRVSSLLAPFVGNVVVSDLSRLMLKQAQKKGALLPVRAHVERLPFPDGIFARVLVVDSLHHFCDQREALSDLLRVLQPGGRLVIEEPNIDRLAVKVVACMEKLTFMGSRFYSPEEIRKMIEVHGVTAYVESVDRFRSWIVVDK